jgi:hypothetical protein
VQQAASFGGLVGVNECARLRRGERLRGPVRMRAASCASSRLRVLALGGTVALAAWSLASADAYGAPGPDPYRPNAAARSAPAPDPDPAARSASTQGSSTAPSPSPSPAPAPVASGGSSTVVERQSVAPARQEQVKPQKRRERQEQPVVRGPQPKASRASLPPPLVRPKTKLNASPVVAVVSSSSARQLAMGGLALLLLAIASGSLVVLVSRDHSWRAEA